MTHKETAAPTGGTGGRRATRAESDACHDLAQDLLGAGFAMTMVGWHPETVEFEVRDQRTGARHRQIARRDELTDHPDFVAALRAQLAVERFERRWRPPVKPEPEPWVPPTADEAKTLRGLTRSLSAVGLVLIELHWEADHVVLRAMHPETNRTGVVERVPRTLYFGSRAYLNLHAWFFGRT